MPRFLAMTARGLSDVLTGELREMGLNKLEVRETGVYFESNWEGCYKVNLRSRIASRVALTILDFPAYNPEDLYHNIKKHDFTKYIDLKNTLAVEAKTHSEIFRDQRFVAMKVKDAIVDQFTEKFGKRPNVDSKDPDLNILVRVIDSSVSVALDTSGGGLFRRGYRVESVEAPLKENLAAALLKMSGWTPEQPLVDPMCGSGTFLIEAALMAKNISPGVLRSHFGFQRWKTYQRDLFKAEAESCLAEERPYEDGRLFGFDIDRKAIEAARANAREAEQDDVIKFAKSAVELIEPPVAGPGVIICNPPYGARLGEVDLLKDTYRNLGYVLKTKFKGWTAWVLSGEPELPGLMGLKSSRRIPVMNGNIECRFLKYDIR